MTRQNHLKISFNYIFKSLAQLIAPRICLICEERLDEKQSPGRYICRKCFDSMPIAPPPKQLREKLYSNFPKEKISINAAACLIDLKEDSRYINLIYALKYSRFPNAGKELGRWTGRILMMQKMLDYDAVLPVPVHPARRRERGFNQAESIAEGITEETGIKNDFKVLKRRKYTSSQTKLKGSERKSNVSIVFKVDDKSDFLKGRKFLLCDDVLTTGSTLNYCAAALKKAGAGRVDAAAAALA